MNENLKIIKKAIFVIALSVIGIIVLYPIGFYLKQYIPIKYKHIIKPEIKFINIREVSSKDSVLLKKTDYSCSSSYLLTINSNQKFDEKNPTYKLFCISCNDNFSYKDIDIINPAISSNNDFILIKQGEGIYSYITAVDIDGRYEDGFKDLTCKIFFSYYLIATFETETFKIPSNKIKDLMKNKVIEKTTN